MMNTSWVVFTNKEIEFINFNENNNGSAKKLIALRKCEIFTKLQLNRVENHSKNMNTEFIPFHFDIEF